MAVKERTIEPVSDEFFLRRMDESLAEQAALAKKTARVTTVCSVIGVLILALILVIAVSMMLRFQALSVGLEPVLLEAQTAASNLSDITETLKDADIAGIFDTLEDALAGLDEAVEALKLLDIETLNNAIKDLESVVQPLAGLFGR